MSVGRLGGGRFRAPNGLGRRGGYALGPYGECICPRCGTIVIHSVDDPCYLKKCPRCGAYMTRR